MNIYRVISLKTKCFKHSLHNTSRIIPETIWTHSNFIAPLSFSLPTSIDKFLVSYQDFQSKSSSSKDQQIILWKKKKRTHNYYYPILFLPKQIRISSFPPPPPSSSKTWWTWERDLSRCGFSSIRNKMHWELPRISPCARPSEIFPIVPRDSQRSLALVLPRGSESFAKTFPLINLVYRWAGSGDACTWTRQNLKYEPG